MIISDFTAIKQRLDELEGRAPLRSTWEGPLSTDSRTLVEATAQAEMSIYKALGVPNDILKRLERRW